MTNSIPQSERDSLPGRLLEEQQHHKRPSAPPRSWSAPSEHLSVVLDNPWYRHLSLLLHTLSMSTHRFFEQKNLVATLLPVTTPSVSSPMGEGSDSLPVRVTLAGDQIYLADSMQFGLELACRITKRGTYYIMPTFRGENVDHRHLSQFFHSEVEIFGGLSDVMTLAEEYIYAMCQDVLNNSADSLAELSGTVSNVEYLMRQRGVFKRLPFVEAVKELAAVDGALEATKDASRITEAGEKFLIQRHGHFVWITNMPWSTVPFYQARDDRGFAQNADLLAGIGEILGCGERAVRACDVKQNLIDQSVAVKDYDWYLQMKSKVECQTSGFGLGIERFLLWLIGHDDIRDCTILLRDHGKPFQP